MIPSFVALKFIALSAALSVAVVTDLRDRRIPNWLTVGGTLVALLLAGFETGAFPTLPIVGALVALLLALPLFALGGIGAGDAKMFAMVGAFLGPAGLLPVVLYGGLAGGIIALASATRRGVILPVLLGTKDLMLYLATLGRHGTRRSLDTPGAHSVPYGIAIAAGAVGAWYFPIRLIVAP